MEQQFIPTPYDITVRYFVQSGGEEICVRHEPLVGWRISCDSETGFISRPMVMDRYTGKLETVLEHEYVIHPQTGKPATATVHFSPKGYLQ